MNSCLQIIGGNVTSINDYPWAAILRFEHKQKQLESWSCSGSYIGKISYIRRKNIQTEMVIFSTIIRTGGRTIVTAAHCVDDLSRRDLGELYAKTCFYLFFFFCHSN